MEFNALNISALISDNEYNRVKEGPEELLRNKTIIYLFEAESDLYGENAKISREFGGNASNGEVLALRGIGYFKVNIANKTFKLESNSLNFVYTPLFNIPKGEYKLEILVSKDSYLDVIWLYSTETNQTLYQLFEVKEKTC